MNRIKAQHRHDGRFSSPILFILSIHVGSASFLVTVNDGVDGDVVLSDFQPVPEPGTMSLLSLAAFGLLARRRRSI